ncbi:MAG TPA: STAS domain-containing protein [Bryobacteraceae bacterium]|nr:STAS domain-containing protein [Bryobacteraceae bacterium]HPT26566.1 STAS domain-containing protein [Bryobacteraceae bacterium]
MAFEIKKRSVDGVPVVEFHGRLVAGPAIEAFRAALDELISGGENHAVLDLTETDYIDSSALGCLVMAHTRFQKAGGKITLFGLSSQQMELLVITKLTTVFALFEDEIDAVNACIPGREPRKFDLLEFVNRMRRQEGGQ